MLTSKKPDLPKTQEQILDAAISCVKKLGIERVSLNDIAKEAGVARSTVYSYYSNKDDVVKFALLQSAYSFAEKVLGHLSQFDTPSERIIEGVMFGLISLPDEPCLALITDTNLAQMVNEHTLTSEPGFNINTEVFRFLIQDDSLPDEVITERAEFTIRTLFSLLTMKSPAKRSYHEQACFVARWLLPPLGLEIPAEYLMGSNIENKKNKAKEA